MTIYEQNQIRNELNRIRLEKLALTDHDEKQKQTACVFVGGRLNGFRTTEYEVEHKLCNGSHQPNDSDVRNSGGCTWYAVLDDIPEVDGYTPMWDGDKIRYETWEVYNMMH